MVYVTGDLHGDLNQFKSRVKSKIKKNDTLIICGDFGFIWDNSKAEQKNLKYLSKRKYTICFVDGVHENYELLKDYPVVEFAGGQAQQISDNVFHLLRGEIYTIEDQTFFAFGGGEEEEEIELRKDFATVWENQMPSEEEMHHGLDTLKTADNQVDFIITHYPSAKLGGRIFQRKTNKPKISGAQLYLNQMEENVTYKHWYFGSYHKDKELGSLHTCVFSKIIPIQK